LTTCLKYVSFFIAAYGPRVHATADQGLELTEENVELVLDEVRPYLMADGGNVEFVEIDGPAVYLR
jgi:Fe-S cluster biogenesis protein NfuA